MFKIIKLSLGCLLIMVITTAVAQQKMQPQLTPRTIKILAALQEQAYEARRLARIQAQLSVAPQAAISVGIVMESSTINNDSLYSIHPMKFDIIGLLRHNGPLTQRRIFDMLWDSGKYSNMAYYSAYHHLSALREIGILKHNKLRSRNSTWELISASQQEIDGKIAANFARKQPVQTEPSEPRKKQKMDRLNALPSTPVAPSPLTLEPTAFSWGLAHAPALQSVSFAADDATTDDVTADDSTSSSSNMSESVLPVPNPVNLLTMPSISFDWTTNRATDLDNLDTAGSHQEDF